MLAGGVSGHWGVNWNVPLFARSQSSVLHVPSNLVGVVIADVIEIEQTAESSGRSVRNAVDPTTAPVREPNVSPVVSERV